MAIEPKKSTKVCMRMDQKGLSHHPSMPQYHIAFTSPLVIKASELEGERTRGNQEFQNEDVHAVDNIRLQHYTALHTLLCRAKQVNCLVLAGITIYPDSITTLGQCWHNVPLRWQIMLAQRNFVANVGPTNILQTVASTLSQHLTFAYSPYSKFWALSLFLILTLAKRWSNVSSLPTFGNVAVGV